VSHARFEALRTRTTSVYGVWLPCRPPKSTTRYTYVYSSITSRTCNERGATAHYQFDFSADARSPGATMSRGWTNLLGGPAAEEPEPAAGPSFSDRMKEALGFTPRASGDGNVLADLRSSLRSSGAPAEEAGTASFLSGITTSLDRSTRSLQTAVGLREEEPPTLLSELDAATTMSYQSVRRTPARILA
jgi:hypothetical protein